MAYYYVRLNPDLEGVRDAAIERSESRGGKQEVLVGLSGRQRELVADALEDMPDEEFEGIDTYAEIDRVYAFGREFIGGGGEVISEEEREALEGDGPEGKTEDGTPLLVVLGPVEGT